MNKLIKVGTVVFVLLAIDFIAELILVRNVKERKKSLKLRVLTRYILVAIFLFSMAKIWVDGFGYFLTFIGVIAAALTITQKEYLMNFFGWLIIMWRDLFVEGDYIEIGRYCGFVKKIRPLYFSIDETVDFRTDKTGRNIKIPNGLIATQPLINLSLENAFVEGKVSYVFSFDSLFKTIQQLRLNLEKEVEQLLNSLYGKSSKPQLVLRIHSSAPYGVELRIRYLSLKHDQRNVEDNIFAMVMEAVSKDEHLILSSQS